MIGPTDGAEQRHARGAFFTPEPIATHLTAWALGGRPEATVLDPTCGEAVFLLAAGRQLRDLGVPTNELDSRLFGVDLHRASLNEADRLLASEQLDAHLVADDFFSLVPPDQLGATLPAVDAVVGNPPFVRYQLHSGDARKRSSAAALAQGVRLNGLASSWASLLVHSSAFLKPSGRLAMVLPAELLTVGYAEPVRAWLRRRFERVSLVFFERLQFRDALEHVVLLLAEGEGGCEAFSLYHVDDADDLDAIQPYANVTVTPQESGKWTDLLLSVKQRRLFRDVSARSFVNLAEYGQPELGSVTGANKYFTLTEETRLSYGLAENQVVKISPPGTRHFEGLVFSSASWESLRRGGDRVWMFSPSSSDSTTAVEAYKAYGYEQGVHQAYKCQVRPQWWRPPVLTPPDLFFTYMSHRYPRLIQNTAKAQFLNSMHGVRLRPGLPRESATALPLLCLNSVTMLGAEVFGRSYGGGILKMEPREAAKLPVPSPDVLSRAWQELKPLKAQLDRKLRAGMWVEVVKRVDAAVLGSACELDNDDAADLLKASRFLRRRRLGNESEG